MSTLAVPETAADGDILGTYEVEAAYICKILLCALFWLYMINDAVISNNASVISPRIDINDVASEIPDIATIHNNRVFEVIQGLSWDEQKFVANSTNTLFWTMFVDGK